MRDIQGLAQRIASFDSVSTEYEELQDAFQDSVKLVERGLLTLLKDVAKVENLADESKAEWADVIRALKNSHSELLTAGWRANDLWDTRR